MAQTITLDPSGYMRAVEPGFHWSISGRELHRLFLSKDAGTGADQARFINPEGTEWILTSPRQWSAGWHASDDLAGYVIRRSKWAFAGGVTTGDWSQSHRADGENNEANEWVEIRKIPAGVSSLFGCDLPGLAAAAKLDLPAGIAVVASTTRLPSEAYGNLLFGDFTPHLQFATYPPPDDLFVFGFHDIALVYRTDVLAICRRTPAGWEKLGTYMPGKGQGVGTQAEGGRSLISAGTRLGPGTRALTCIPVGGQYLHVAGSGISATCKIRDVPGLNVADPMFARGGWWVAGAPGGHLAYQVQVVGYTEATYNPAGAAPAAMYDLGSSYEPTEEPGLNGLVSIVRPSSTVSLTAGKRITSLGGGTLEVQLLDEAGAAWSSDGTHHRGGLRLTIQPSLQGRYQVPQARVFQVRWPPKLVARANDALELDDTEFAGWEAEESLYGLADKRATIYLTPAGAAKFRAASVGARDGYPVHIADGTDRRLAAWVETPTITRLRWESADLETGEQVHVETPALRCEGLAGGRLSGEWKHVPQMVDPSQDGTIEHTWAVTEALRCRGFDTDDSDAVTVQTDPMEGTALSQLPGTWGQLLGGLGERVDCPWAPSWDESPLAYVERIARYWSAWWIHEDLFGTVHYEPDLTYSRLIGEDITPEATLYWRAEDSEAAEAPGQHVLAEPAPEEETVSPEANYVRISGQAADGEQAPHVLDGDLRSITDPEYEDYLGEERIKGAALHMAISEASMRQLARVMILRTARRKRLWRVTVPLAPWEWKDGEGEAITLRCGKVITLDGEGDYVVNHLHVRCLRTERGALPAVYRTALVLERLPASGAVVVTE